MNNLDTLGNWYLDDLKYIDEPISDQRKLKKGDFIFNRTNSVELVGKSGVIDFEGTWAGYLIRLRLYEKLNPFYLRYLFATNRYRKLFSQMAKPAGGQANINAEELTNIKIDYFNADEQKEIVEKLDKVFRLLSQLRELKYQAQQKIEKILSQVLGEENNHQ